MNLISTLQNTVHGPTPVPEYITMHEEHSNCALKSGIGEMVRTTGMAERIDSAGFEPLTLWTGTFRSRIVIWRWNYRSFYTPTPF